MAATDNDFKEFEDTQFHVRVPAYLRRRQKLMLFVAPTNRRFGQSLLSFAVNLPRDREESETWRQAMEVVKSYTWEDVQFTVIRQGPTKWLSKGYELLATTRHVGTGAVHHHDLTVLFRRRGKVIQARVLGTGDLETFERLCRVLIDGIQLKEGGCAR